jgi:hypothetical protein
MPADLGSTLPMNQPPSIAYIVAELLDEEERAALTEAANSLLGEMDACDRGLVWNLCESIWPTYEFLKRSRAWEDRQPVLRLVPLDRIGGEAGFSGSRVLIAYFELPTEHGASLQERSGERPWPSQPMVVKLRKLDRDNALAEEFKRAQGIRPLLAHYMSSFAVPIHHVQTGGNPPFSVLWSPFSPSRMPHGESAGPDSSPHSYSFSQLLRGEPRAGSETKPLADERSVLESVFQLLAPLHTRGGTARTVERQIVEEYAKYLRKVDTEAWREPWEECWGRPDTRDIRDLGRGWVNPLWVLEKLRSAPPYHVMCGAIHGDLHPRNVVLSHADDPHILDFAWASTDSHIAKDLVLLECNLRFVLLRPDVSFEDLEALTGWMSFEGEPPSLQGEYCRQRLALIRELRANARRLFPATVDWDREYITPLFLTALGLLKHIRSFDNQLAGRMSVLHLADYIDGRLISHGP